MDVSNTALIDVSRILKGKQDHLDIAVEVPFDDTMDTSDIQLADSAFVSGKIDNTAGYIHLTADFDVEYDTQCARCLKPLHFSRSFTLDKTLCAKENIEDENADEIIMDYAVAENGFLDMGELVREHVILSLPSRHLCDENCRGLCPKCGHNLNEGDCSCEKGEIDPRMEVFREILKQYNE